MLPAVTTSLPTCWLYIMTLSSVAFFLRQEDLVQCSLRQQSQKSRSESIDMPCTTTPPPPPASQDSSYEAAGISQTHNYKCDELKWQKYLVGGGWAVGTRAKMYPVAGCFVFLFFTICDASFQEASRANIACLELRSLSPLLLRHVCPPKNTMLTFQDAARSYFLQGTLDGAQNVQSLEWGAVGDLAIARNDPQGSPERFFPSGGDHIVVRFYFGFKITQLSFFTCPLVSEFTKPWII